MKQLGAVAAALAIAATALTGTAVAADHNHACKRGYLCVWQFEDRKKCSWEGDDWDWGDNCKAAKLPIHYYMNAGTGSYSHIKIFSRPGGKGSSACLRPGYSGYGPDFWANGPDKGEFVQYTVSSHVWVNSC